MANESVNPYNAGDPHLWVKLEHVGRYCFAADMLKRAPGALHLDLGCASGYGLAELVPFVGRAVGVDYDRFLLETAAQRLHDWSVRLVQADLDIESLPDALGESGFDSVTAFEFLEHLHDPPRTLRQLRQCVRLQGLLMVSVPNARYDSGSEHHHHTFQTGELAAMLTACGFQVERTLGQGTVNRVDRRETRLVRLGQFDERPSALPGLHTPDIIRKLALVLAYPDEHDLEFTYSHILVARAC